MLSKVLVGCVAVAVALTGSLSAVPAYANTEEVAGLNAPLAEVIDLGANTGASDIGFSPDGKLAYVLGRGDGSFNIVDLETNTLVKKIDLGWSFGGHMVVNSTGTTAYITVGSGYWDRNLMIFDIASETATSTQVIGDGTVTAGAIMLSPDDASVYLAPSSGLLKIDAASGEVEAKHVVGVNTNVIAQSKDGSRVYAHNNVSDEKFVVLDAQDFSVINEVPTPGLNIDAFTVGNDPNILFAYGETNKAITFDLSTGAEVARQQVGGGNRNIVLSADETRLFTTASSWAMLMAADLTKGVRSESFRDLGAASPGELAQNPVTGDLFASDKGWNDDWGNSVTRVYFPSASDPTDQKAAKFGDVVTFSSDVVGVKEVRGGVNWQSSADGKVWTDIDDATLMTLEVPVDASTVKLSYRLTYTDDLFGQSGETAAAKIVLDAPVVVDPKDPVNPKDPKDPVNPKEPKLCTTPRKVAVFADTPVSHKFYKEIDWMECMKYSTGWKQATGKPVYKPQDNLQRAAMAAFIYRMEAPKNYKAPKVSPFADVQPGDKFYKEISWMHTAKLSTGYKEASGKPTYRPYDSLTREAMAAFIYRLDASKNAKTKAYKAPASSPLADMKPGMKFFKEISWMYEVKLTTGNKTATGKEYWPKDELSRQAMAAFIYRLKDGGTK